MTIVGVGNLFRGDDGAGLAVAREIRASRPELRVIEQAGDLLDLFDRVGEETAVIIVDAISSGATAGDVFCWDASSEPIPARALRGSTHGFGVSEAIELARATGRLPASVLLLGIEGGCFDAGAGLSPAVAAAIPDLVQRVILEAKSHA